MKRKELLFYFLWSIFVGVFVARFDHVDIATVRFWVIIALMSIAGSVLFDLFKMLEKFINKL